eukprot:CAMPEP_0175185230 /NCGR_PEP_ID=MMETSP0093-20121207/1774_1 /TAXON_ID=311494 /ORGANISM="Alexandrium monilatum, Strain CCMP3105" /LENGTH=151 /DNA_ID=CAMNT_0016477925 /DNA_START=39 /DNA_END=491 /DNA_ORIENTATION=+
MALDVASAGGSRAGPLGRKRRRPWNVAHQQMEAHTRTRPHVHAPRRPDAQNAQMPTQTAQGSHAPTGALGALTALDLCANGARNGNGALQLPPEAPAKLQTSNAAHRGAVKHEETTVTGLRIVARCAIAALARYEIAGLGVQQHPLGQIAA